MRKLLAASTALALILSLLGTAEAQQRRKRSSSQDEETSSSQWSKNRNDADSFTSGKRGDSKDDIDARAADPGGDYGNYPSWARKALGGNKDMGQ